MKVRPTIGRSGNGSDFRIGEKETDQHSAVYNIDTDESLEIRQNKQMIVFNKLLNKGLLKIRGQLIIR